MDLSVIIVNWNTRALLEQCLGSVYDARGGEAPEVFLVDNGSEDGSPAMVRSQFPRVKLIENQANLGFARACNQAIRRARSAYVVLLNSDTCVHRGALEALVAFMEENGRAGACGPRLLNRDGSLQPSCHPMLTPWREFWRLTFLDRVKPLATYDLSTWDLAASHEVDVIKGACLMLRREALHEVGPLDERYFMYTEEMDLCYRLQAAGWKRYWVPQAVVTHYGEASTRQVAEEMYVELYRSKTRFHRKFGGQGRARLFKILVALAYAPRWLVSAAGRIFSRQLSTRSRIYRRLLAELPAM